MICLRFVLNASFKHILGNLKSSLIIFFSLTVCTLCALLMTEAMIFSSSFLENIDTNMRTYNLNMPSYLEDYSLTYDFFNKITHESSLPSISRIIGIYASPVMSKNVDEYIVPEVFIEGDPRFAQFPNIISGRTFSSNEIITGEDVIIISQDVNYWRDNKYVVGDYVYINEIAYEIIGIDSNSSYITEKNVMMHHSFSICINQLQFTHPLSSDEEALLVSMCTYVSAHPINIFSQYLSDYVVHTLTYSVLIILVTYCAFSIIAQLFDYMVKNRLYEYKIYKVLGIKKHLLFFLFYTPIIMISFCSIMSGFLMYRFTDTLQNFIGLDHSLSATACTICWCIFVIVLLLTTYPQFIRLVRQPAVETR